MLDVILKITITVDEVDLNVMNLIDNSEIKKSILDTIGLPLSTKITSSINIRDHE